MTQILEKNLAHWPTKTSRSPKMCYKDQGFMVESVMKTVLNALLFGLSSKSYPIIWNFVEIEVFCGHVVQLDCILACKQTCGSIVETSAVISIAAGWLIGGELFCFP